MNTRESEAQSSHSRGHDLLQSAVRHFSLVSHVGISLFLLGMVLWKPAYDWDMIGYVACAKEAEIKDPVSLHKWVFDKVKATIGTERFNEINHTPYRNTITDDPRALQQQLPFSRVRVLYVAAIAGLSKLGINVFLAAHLVSALACILGLWGLWAAFAGRVDGPLLGLIPLFALACGMLKVATQSSPDGLAFFMVAVLVLLLARRSRWTLVLVPVSVLARADLLLFGLPVLGFVWFRGDGRRSLILLSAAAAVVTTVVVCRWSGHYGMRTLLYCNYVKFLPYPADTEFHLHFADYLVGWRQGLRKLLFNTPFFVFVTVIMAAALCLLRSSLCFGERRMKWFLIVGSTFYVTIHFVLFPSMMERFFIGQYLMGAMALVWILGEAAIGRNAAVSA